VADRGWTRRRFRLSLFGVLALSACCVGVAAQQFGELPAGALSTTEQGLSSELVVYVIFDPAAHKDQLPDGLRFRTLEEYAPRDAEVAQYLRTHPEHGSWARGYFEIIHADSYSVDGQKARFGKRGGIAVWYAYLARPETNDPRAKGGQLVALGTWISDSKLARRMREKGFPMSEGRVSFWRDSKGTHGRLKGRGFEVSGTCRPVGAAEKIELPTPAYLTVWSPRAATQTFELLTGYGSMSQNCEGVEWKAKGDDPFVRAFLARAQGGAEISGTSYEYGYVLRTALYQRK
jgi:hypothetical protein